MRVRLTLLALFATGCIQTGDFDPVGNAASISGSWTIDGQPASSTTCEALGAQVIQVSFLDVLRPVTHSGLLFECRTGSFDTDAPGGSGQVIAAPEMAGAPWALRFEAIDSSGAVISVGETLTVFVPETEVIILPEEDFQSATAVTQFRVSGESPNAARCEDAGIVEVRLDFDDPSTVSSATVEPCALGSVGARIEAGVEHTARLVAVGTEGAEVRSEPVTFTSIAGGQVTLSGSPFELTALSP